jgi:integrase
MPSIIQRGGRWRALVRKAGTTRCETFATKAAAKSWAATIERQIDELKASGVMNPGATTLGDLIDRYVREQYARKPWGRSKSADLARLKRDLGHQKVADITSRHVTKYFEDRNAEGSGGVVVSAQAGYLVKVLEVARSLWHLDVPLQAVKDARQALSAVGLVQKSRRRDRRVTDAELEAIIEQIEKKDTALPVRDILQFCAASAMRISEVCRLQWSDLNEQDRTIVIRDRKHPKDKLGNDQLVPLLSATGFDAFAIVQRQPRRGPVIFPINPKTLSTYVTNACTALCLSDVSLHDLRHEGISRLFAAGYRIEQVALVSGHRDWAMLKRYTHVRAADLHRGPQS